LFCNPFEVYVVAMQGFLTVLTTACAATFQFAVAPGMIHFGGGWCGTGEFGRQRAPTLEQRLSAAGLPELSEAFGMEVAETPEVLRQHFRSEPQSYPAATR
jgi:hypothetical protein